MQAADSGGGKNRNRCRLATGRELLRDLSQALAVAIETLSAQQRWQRRTALISLREAVEARLVIVCSEDFMWLCREPFFPGFDITSLAATFEQATEEASSVLESSRSRTPDRVIATSAAVAANARSSETARVSEPSSSNRSRTPAPRDLDILVRVPVLFSPRPRIGGMPNYPNTS